MGEQRREETEASLPAGVRPSGAPPEQWVSVGDRPSRHPHPRTRCPGQPSGASRQAGAAARAQAAVPVSPTPSARDPPGARHADTGPQRDHPHPFTREWCVCPHMFTASVRVLLVEVLELNET